MKKNLLLLFAMAFMSWNVVYAALPDGSTAQDWTLTDLNGTSHNLYSYLNAGTPVIIDFSATWCGPCWSYHNTGILENLYTDYGPGGTNELMVFFIEPDGSTNTDCLYGLPTCVGGTTGNWVNGTPYPIIDLTGSNLSVASNYNVTYYPTLYAISPDARTWEVGQASQATWEHWMLESFNLEVTSSNVANATCSNNGAIDITAIGGYGNKFYNWSNGMTGANISGLAEGIYTVTINDNNSYFITESFTVGGSLSGQPLGLDILSQIDALCNGDSNGSAEVQGTFGNYGYSYAWSTGATGPIASNLAAGTYTVSVTDAANCMDEFDITLTEPEVLYSVAIETDDNCGGSNGEVLFVPQGGTAPYSFDIGFGMVQEVLFTDLAAGFYSYIQQDANGCLYFDQFDIQVVGVPVAMAAAASDLDCTTTSTTVSGSGSSTGSQYQYLWTSTNGNIMSDPTLIDITVDQPGDYNLEITNSGYGCMTVASASVIEVISLPNANAGAPSTITCNIPTITLDGSASDAGPDYTYLWTTPDGNIVSGADGLAPVVDAAGTYTLAVTNTLNGCVATSDVIVPSDFAQPSITAVGGEITCSATSVEICATVDPGVTVTWGTPNGDVVANCIMVSAAGMYTATATGSNGCISAAAASVTQSSEIPQTAITAPDMITCAIQQVTLNGSLTGDPADHTILWTTTNGNIVSGENTLTPIVNMGGSYIMSVTDNTNGCASQVSATVAADISLPVAGFSFTSAIGSLELSNSSSNNIGDIIWDLGNGETAMGETVEASYEETGTYTVCVTVNNECGVNTHCQDIQFVTIMSYSEAIADVKCFGDTDGSITVTPEGGLPAYTIAWDGPNGYTSTELSISDLAAGVYTMVLNDDGGNSSTEQFTIVEPTLLVLTTASTNVACNGGNNGTLSVTAAGGTAPYMYDLGQLDPDQLPAGSYPVIVTDANGCISETSADITQPSAIMNSSTDIADANGGQSNGSITIDPTGGTGAISVKWNNGMTGSAITGLPAGEYTATLTDQNGCSFKVGPITVKSISSIADLDFVSKFSLNPNPASNIVNLNIDFNRNVSANVTIKNLVGQTVYNQNYHSDSTINSVIDVTRFDAGMYLIILSSENAQASHKFIVVK